MTPTAKSNAPSVATAQAPAARRPQGPATPPGVTTERPGLRRDLFESTWNLFCSVRFAVVLILILAAATTLGTILPQISPGLRDFPQDYADFMSRAQVRFGPVTAVMAAAGLFDLYNSFWFSLLILLI